MNIWDQDAYLKAWNFASAIHMGQTIPGSEIPYINHLGLVCMEG
jgi:guanosine-3',5'-bis(diphosphate) 3'-pyrophosphohydrolase